VIPPRQGDLVIDARVRARLLGLHLLDIDAQIVVAPARSAPTLAAAGTRRGGGSGGDGASGPQEMQRRIGISSDSPAPPELAYAARLIAEGSNLLDEATRAR
jgi:hypothetical protein